MSIKIQTNLDYEAFCEELGLTLEELLHIVNNKDKHLSPPQTIVPLVQVIDEYVNNIKKLEKLNRRSETTLSTYLNFLERVKAFVNKNQPNLSVSELNEDIIYELLDDSTPRKNEKLSPNTVNKYMAIVRSVLKYALLRGYTEKDLRNKFTLGTISTLPRYLNDLQAKEVLNRALQKTYGYRKRAMLLFLLGTGCRVSELTNLKVCDFIVDENLIFIRKGKGNKERYIPIFNKVKTTVLNYLKMSGVEKWSPDIKGYLFSPDEGLEREKKVLDRSVQYLVRGLFDSMGLGKDYTVHTFRHTFAVNCLKNGIREEILMQMLGHEDPKTTAIYTKLKSQDLKEEVMKYYPFPFEELLKDMI
ncbi:tyrosine-type recombinase/integrase [Metabacillus litoralis]|uniref:tyrosine-type recombinase/integrase n=1 Tax=Metabacillus litoralis TaxID=152268 RepID=UPI00203D7D5E|nr:tyrosine-type recombinase/integrase [Metabacillus litoralis]MCM3160805.1 tyrosine-type recombinase/integrase [Metabacillus litoralis]